MADTTIPNQADILGSIPSGKNSDSSSQDKLFKTVSKISKSLDDISDILKSGNISQSNAKNLRDTYKDKKDSKFRDSRNRESSSRSKLDLDDDIFKKFKSQFGKKGSGLLDTFLEGFEESVYEGIGFNKFRKGLSTTMSGVLKDFEVNLEDIPSQLGKQLGTKLSSTLENTPIFSNLYQKLQDVSKGSLETIQTKFEENFRNFDLEHGTDFSKKFKHSLDKYKYGDQSTDTYRRIFEEQDAINSEDPWSYYLRESQETAFNRIDNSMNPSDSVHVNDTGILDKSYHCSLDSNENLAVISHSTTDILGVLCQLYEQLVYRKVELDEDFSDDYINHVVDSTHAESFDSHELESGSDIANDTLAEKMGSIADLGQSGLEDLDVTSFLSSLGEGSEIGQLLEVGLSALGEGLLAIAPELIAVAAVAGLLSVGLTNISNSIDLMKDKYDEFEKEIFNSLDSYNQMLMTSAEEENKRLYADVETIVKEPFEILEDAANKVVAAWESALETITQTQGYTKSDVQDLMSSYAARLQESGLTSSVSAANIVSNLESVLNAGLSGEVAEEFAYLATVLNEAIPTQDFFSYASTYSSIAANAIQDGKSQSEAIEIANESLTSFANNLLYASRSVAGGYSTGLSNADTLYSQAAKIAQAAGTDNYNEISSVLTSVAALVGAVAPDLANSITDAVYNAATGGNDSSTVALRSLAGVNASNTEFLRELAENPQEIFANLFDNLDYLFSQSSDAYMEKAEAYASLFGLSAEAFQRIDFSYLSDAISNMSSSSDALSQNVALLSSGESTLTKEQQVNAQINEYMLEEGLSYVLDNEAARVIQQHMWDEQMKLELMDNEYGVNLVGSGLEFLQSIRSTVSNILDFLNPVGWFKKVTSLVANVSNYSALEEEIAEVVELGKVGAGNSTAFTQLTTRGEDLNLTDRLVEILGGSSTFQSWNESYFRSDFLGDIGSVISGIGSMIDDVRQSTKSTSSEESAISSPSSKYDWGVVSKSTAKGLQELTAALKNQSQLPSTNTYQVSYDEQAIQNLNSILDTMLSDDYMVTQYISQGKTYDEWVNSAKSLGISDFESVISQLGYSTTQLQSYFESKETEQGKIAQNEIRESEKLFRETGIKFWSEDFPFDYRDPLFEKVDKTNSLLEVNNERLSQIILNQEQWFVKWTEFLESDSGGWYKYYNQMAQHVKNFSDYFIKHIYYDSSGYNYQQVVEVQQKESQQSGDAIYALAEALTINTNDFTDPQVQANSILSQILIVVNAIMNQNNDSAGSLSLADTLSALSMGMTK